MFLENRFVGKLIAEGMTSYVFPGREFLCRAPLALRTLNTRKL